MPKATRKKSTAQSRLSSGGRRYCGRVLVFGGSFDPPHKCHLELLEKAVKEFNPDKTLVFPAFHSPLKNGAAAAPQHRVSMLRLALVEGGLSRKAEIDLFEINRGRKTYTYEVLRHVRERFPGAEVYLLMGSDSAITLPRWKRPSELASCAVIAVGRRGRGEKLSDLPRGFSYKVVPGVFPNVSSTSARREMLSDGDIPPEVPRRVRTYIEKQGLYAQAMHRWLRANLSPRRYRHTVEVARLAQRLALKWGQNHNDAAVAALLHDAGKTWDASQLAAHARPMRRQIPYFSQISRYQPGILHSYVSAALARRLFGVSSPAILGAIENHTLGTADMTLLEKILYLADISSEDRDFSEAGDIRRESFRDMDAALFMAAKVKLRYVFKSDKWLCPRGIELWNHLAKKRKAK